MDIATQVRIAYLGALSGLEYKGKSIPIFDEIVVEGVPIPTIDRATEVYVVLQGQQTIDDSTQDYCNYRLISDMTIRVVTKFIGDANKSICEAIGNLINDRLREGRDKSKVVGINKIRCDVSRSIIETSVSHTAFSKVLIYRNYINK